MPHSTPYLEASPRKALATMRSRMIMQVHDELIFNVKPEERDELLQLVTYEMEDSFHGAVPLIVSAGIATNWLEAH